MPTIFDGYNKLTDEQIKNQIVILETINFGNILKHYTTKVKVGTIKAIRNIISNLDANKEVKPIEVKEIKDILEENKKEINNLSRQELEIRLRLLLCDKVGVEIEQPEEEASIYIINEAVKSFDMKEHLTPAQKINKVYEEYNKRVLNYLQKTDEYDSRNIHENLNFLTYILINSIKSWNMLQGSRKIDIEVLAQATWLSAFTYGKKFTPSIGDVPSGKLDMSQEEIVKEDDYFIKLETNYIKSEKELEYSEIRLMDLEESLNNTNKQVLNKKEEYIVINNSNNNINKQIIDIEEELMYIENNIEQLEKEVEYISDKIDIESSKVLKRYNEIQEKYEMKRTDIKSLKLEIIENKSIIYSINKDIIKFEKDINYMEIEIRYLEDEIKRLKEVRRQSKKDYFKEKSRRFHNLKELWEEHFTKISIHPHFIEEVVKYRFNNRIEIEKVIKEIYDAEYPEYIAQNFDKEDMNENYYVEIVLNEYKKVRIEYKTLNDEEIKLELLRFYHGENI